MSAARMILLAQTTVGAIAGVAAWLLFDAVAAYSAWLGGAVCVIPNVYLAMRMMAATPSGEPRRLLRATYFGEVGKLVLTAVLFTVVFVAVRPLSPGAVIAGFVAAQSGIWFAIVRRPDALD